MTIKTKFFGQVNIEETQIIDFIKGIPGFSENKQYIILTDEDSDFVFLQAIDEESLCFITVPPANIVGDYTFDLNEETVERLELEKAEDVLVLSLLNIPDDFKKMTANLKAPIIINIKNNKGIQELLDDDRFDIRHPVFRGEE